MASRSYHSVVTWRRSFTKCLCSTLLIYQSCRWTRSSCKGKLKPGARIYAETGQFLVPLKKEEKATFVDRVKELAAGFTPAKVRCRDISIHTPVTTRRKSERLRGLCGPRRLGRVVGVVARLPEQRRGEVVL